MAIKGELKPLSLSLWKISGLAPLNISTDLALISDSVILFAEALRQLNGSRQLRPTMLSCDDDLTWGHGYSIVNYMKTVIRGSSCQSENSP